MKQLLTIVLIFLCFVSKAQTQDTETGYSLCSSVIAAKTIMMAGLRHHDAAFEEVYMRDANSCAMQAKSIFLRSNSLLKKKLKADEIQQLREVIDYFVNTTSDPEAVTQWSDERLQKTALLSGLLDLKFARILPKLLK